MTITTQTILATTPATTPTIVPSPDPPPPSVEFVEFFGFTILDSLSDSDIT